MWPAQLHGSAWLGLRDTVPWSTPGVWACAAPTDSKSKLPGCLLTWGSSQTLQRPGLHPQGLIAQIPHRSPLVTAGQHHRPGQWGSLQRGRRCQCGGHEAFDLGEMKTSGEDPYQLPQTIPLGHSPRPKHPTAGFFPWLMKPMDTSHEAHLANTQRSHSCISTQLADTQHPTLPHIPYVAHIPLVPKPLSLTTFGQISPHLMHITLLAPSARMEPCPG